MDAIRSYLENMFFNLPRTPDVLRAKDELYQMMEDKYQQLRGEGKTDNESVGQVIAEFGNLAKLASQLGISQQVSDAGREETAITMSEVQVAQYLEENERTANKIGRGVVLILVGVMVLIGSVALGEMSFLRENVAVALGVGALLIAVAIAVYSFITGGITGEKYEALDYRTVMLDQQTRIALREAKETHRPGFAQRIGLGVVLIMVGVIVLVTVALLFDGQEYLSLFGAIFLLAMVAIAVYLFITSSMRSSAYDKLLNEGDYTARQRKGAQLAERLAAPYWALVTTGYLAWSFIWSAWGISWIVFPIAGVLFGLISAIVSSLPENNNRRRV